MSSEAMQSAIVEEVCSLHPFHILYFIYFFILILCCDSEAAQCLTDYVMHHGGVGCSVDLELYSECLTEQQDKPFTSKD